MARNSKNTTSKNDVEDVKTEVTVDNIENNGVTDVVDNNVEAVNADSSETEHVNDNNETISYEAAAVENNAECEDVDASNEDDSPKEFVALPRENIEAILSEDKAEEVKKTTNHRWAEEVYGYNWMGQCYDM